MRGHKMTDHFSSQVALKDALQPGSLVADKTSPLEPGSQVAGKHGQGAILPYIEQRRSQAADKTSPLKCSQVFLKDASPQGSKVYSKVGGQPGSQAPSHGLLVPAVNAANGLPAGKSFAQLGFGATSPARFQDNAITITGGARTPARSSRF